MIKTVISKDVFDRELELCRKVSRENGGKCCWGDCKTCGVIPLLHKLCKGEVIHDLEELKKMRKNILSFDV